MLTVKNYEKAKLKKCVFSFFLNVVESSISRSSAGREFQAAGPANENARSPNFILSRGVTYDDDFADRSPERDALSATDRTQAVM
jgi:hypothetical protein